MTDEEKAIPLDQANARLASMGLGITNVTAQSDSAIAGGLTPTGKKRRSDAGTKRPPKPAPAPAAVPQAQTGISEERARQLMCKLIASSQDEAAALVFEAIREIKR